MKLITYLILLTLSIFTTHAHDKWIVVTTIQSPTNQLKKMAQIENWQLLVVGDQRTPSDWHLENCIYLSPETQLSLGYALADMLPWNHYSRKNIGYLYAIQHGAKLIYDTDDDNEPIGALNPISPDSTLPIMGSNELCANIYKYFDRPDVWPRGYPLEKITSSRDFHIVDDRACSIGIEQGIVNNDPDVDAIFRLTHHGPIHIFFESKAAIALEKEVYCPTNSQNTFFHHDAFFTLYLPSSVNMRVADIWRGYWAQKLLNTINLYTIFSGPSAVQERNDHNFFVDFICEYDLYIKSMKLIEFLNTWKHEKGNPLYTMLTLLHNLATQGFIRERELPLCHAWIDDLKKIGYTIQRK